MTKSDQTNKKIPSKTNKKIFRRISIFLVCVILIVSGWKCPQTSNFGKYLLDVIRQSDLVFRDTNEPSWAQKIDLPGAPNLHKVSDDLYRGAQPTAEGMKQLEKLGIKTIINLRSVHSDRDEMEDVKMAYEHIRMIPLEPDIDDIVRLLNIVTDSNNTPVLVHCRHGADRTGVMCAIYRVIIQGWSREQAAKEMTEGGFGFHSIWGNLSDYIHKLDIDKIKQKAGLIEKTDTPEL